MATLIPTESDFVLRNTKQGQECTYAVQHFNESGNERLVWFDCEKAAVEFAKDQLTQAKRDKEVITVYVMHCIKMNGD